MKNHQVTVYEICEMFARKWLERMAEYAVFENRDAINESYLYNAAFYTVAQQYGYKINIKEFVQQYLMSEYILKIKDNVAQNVLDVAECLKRSEIPVTLAQYEIA
jgi:cobalamin biosynthesis Mg chelatase CobN